MHPSRLGAAELGLGQEAGIVLERLAVAPGEGLLVPVDRVDPPNEGRVAQSARRSFQMCSIGQRRADL